MKILKNIFELNKAVKNYKNVGFVPTMGGIHKGHVSLIKISQKNNKETIVSIFVNPTQFNQKKDFKNYPRNIKKDISILKKLKVNYLFLPDVDEIYKNKMKIDPAISSSVFVTTITDVIGFVSFLGVGAYFL